MHGKVNWETCRVLKQPHEACTKIYCSKSRPKQRNWSKKEYGICTESKIKESQQTTPTPDATIVVFSRLPHDAHTANRALLPPTILMSAHVLQICGVCSQ